MPGKPQLCEILTEHQTVSPQDLERVLRDHEGRDEPLAEHLVKAGLVDEEDLFFLLSRSLGLPAIPEDRLLHLSPSSELRRRVPRSLARASLLVPLDLDVQKAILSVAMFDPSDRVVLERLRKRSKVPEIRTYLARRSAILHALETVYVGEDGDDWSDTEPPELVPVKAVASSEAKVELDPELAEEIAALGDRAAVEVRGAPRPAPAVHPLARRARAEREARLAVPRPAFVSEDMATGIHELRGRSLIHSPAPPSPPPDAFSPPPEPTHEIELEDLDDSPADSDPDFAPMPAEITQVTPVTTIARDASLPDVRRMEEVDALLKELLSSVGVLVSMLEERIDPAGGGYREYGRISRLAARELGMDELTVARVSLAAHLYGLDLALRRELGMPNRLDVTAAFGTQPGAPGGLGPSLRTLGARALDLRDETPPPPGVALIRLVADYLDLRAEAEESDHETVAQLLRAGGADTLMVEALLRAVEGSETQRVRLELD